MKKIITSTMAAVLAFFSLSSCTNPQAPTAAKLDNVDRISIVCTIFPEYDWIREVLGDHIENTDLTMLLDNGVDLHSYQPTTDDIIKISTCDMFVYVGGESDAWVKDALKEATNKDMIVINLIDVLGDVVKEEELVEGMELEEHNHNHEDDQDHEGAEVVDHEDDEVHEHEKGNDHEHEDKDKDTLEYDEHIWLSLKNAEILSSYIGKKLGEIDSKNAADYANNAKVYAEKLDLLDEKYEATVINASQRTLLFGDRFPFRYLVDDYGLSYYAAFVGCSAETEASFETIAFLSGKVDELRLHSVLTIDGSQHKIAETIVENTQQKNQIILTLNSMQSITSKDIKNGMTYLSIMEKNLEVLKAALN
ncbi:metal ABC transporter substrate-binding protein [Anaerotignum sp.]|uniref:metal ABC transporter substrate-binding protein n=1 Tax=Anaerotignum sp. TaxID=2039241 RepID=UPI0028AC45F8|nr:metal ABC transporter substrate-binding protein [Anaerotignum sp.]